MPVFNVKTPDGSVLKVNAPDGATEQQAIEFAAKTWKPKAAENEDSGIAQGMKNIGAGALSGAAQIGATILSPIDYAAKKLGVKDSSLFPADRRAAIESGLRGMGADPESVAFQAGQMGAEIAGTAGAGGALAKGLKFAPQLASAVESGGFRLAQPAQNALAGLATRTAGGAISGGAANALVNPSSALGGAAIGALVPGTARVAQAIGSGAGKLAAGTIGTMAGTGSEVVKTAYRSGKEGSGAFLENMRGNADMASVLDDAKSALSAMRADRAAEYRAGMGGVSADKTVLDISPIVDAVKNIENIGSYKGQQINKNAAGTVDDISQTISKWASLDPAEYHTPEGMDALKRAIGDIRDSTQFGTPGRKAADQAYNAVKRQIEQQAPDYSKVMKSYSDASDLISEVQRSLSLGEKASADTAMRKLQSLMRNNVQTNYGNRLKLAQELATKGGQDILPAVAGQTMSSLSPRGLARVEQVGLGGLSLINPWALAALPFTSPRLMGEFAYGAGRATGAASGGVNALLANPAIANKLADPALRNVLTVAPSLMFNQ